MTHHRSDGGNCDVVPLEFDRRSTIKREHVRELLRLILAAITVGDVRTLRQRHTIRYVGGPHGEKFDAEAIVQWCAENM